MSIPIQQAIDEANDVEIQQEGAASTLRRQALEDVQSGEIVHPAQEALAKCDPVQDDWRENGDCYWTCTVCDVTNTPTTPQRKNNLEWHADDCEWVRVRRAVAQLEET